MKKTATLALLVTFFVFILEENNLWAQQNNEDSSKYAAFYQKNFYATKTSPLSFTTEVPFKEIAGLIIVEVRIGETVYHFIFDTGAINVISTELTKKLALISTDSLAVFDGNRNGFVQHIYQLPQTQIGGITFSNLGFAAVDLKTVSTLLCQTIDGIVGAPWMRSCKWKIDFKRKVLAFSNQPHFLQHQSEILLSFKEDKEGGLPLIMGNFAGEEITFLFDSGNDGELDIPIERISKLRKTLRSTPSRTGHGTVSFSAYGAKKGVKYELRAQEISLGTQSFKNRKIQLEKGLRPLIGTQFMRDYIVSLDWANHQIGLTPNAVSAGKADSTFGFSVDKDSAGLFVSFIWDGSEADKKGIKIGDRIIALAATATNTPVKYYCDAKALLNHSVTLNLKTARGSQPIREQILYKQPSLK